MVSGPEIDEALTGDFFDERVPEDLNLNIARSRMGVLSSVLSIVALCAFLGSDAFVRHNDPGVVPPSERAFVMAQKGVVAGGSFIADAVRFSEDTVEMVTDDDSTE